VACDRELAVRDAHTLAVLRPIAQLAQTVRSVAWSTDGKTVASCGRDVEAHSWDVDSGIPRAFPVDEHCYKVAFSPDGGRLGAVTRKTVRVWDLAASSTSALVGHHNEVGALAFVDVETIVTRAQDKTAGVWVDNRLVDLWPHPDGSNESPNAPEALAIRGRDVVTVSGTDVLVWRLPAPVEPATVDAVVRALPFQLRDDVLTPR
jgi:WD40 repeat protein